MSAWQRAQKEIEDKIGKENIECMMTFKKILKKL